MLSGKPQHEQDFYRKTMKMIIQNKNMRLLYKKYIKNDYNNKQIDNNVNEK